MEPRLRHAQISMNRGGRDVERGRDLVVGEPTIEVQLDDLLLALVERSQLLESSLQVEDVDRRRVGGDALFQERRSLAIPTSFETPPSARMLHENSPHRAGGDGEEVDAIRPCDVRADQTLVGFVDERGRLHGMRAGLAPQLAARQAFELVVDERDHLIESLGIPAVPLA
jgi:hypothetical protein